MREESFSSRYFIKIASSIIIATLNIVIQMLIPRALTVEEFGFYSYNLNTFTSTVVLANLSMSNALVAKFSKRNDEVGLVHFYLKFYLIEVIVLGVGLALLYPLPFIHNAFVGQTIIMVLLGLEAAAVTKFLADVIAIYDAMAIAKVSAVFQIILKVLVCSFVAICYFAGKLSLSLFYCGQVVLTLGVAVVLLFIILRYQKKKYPVIKYNCFRNYVKEYTAFCRPLVISTIFSQFMVIVMNWCLMRFSGANEQAMFGVAWQLNALVTYVFAPYAELSKREYSVVSKDNETLKQFYGSSLRRMFWLTAYFGCFIGFCNDWILTILYEDKYSEAGLATLLIMIYTVYQAWGQMSGAFMIATERTKMNAVLGIVGQIITIGLVFIFQIPNVIWPEGLGAVGIALVYVVGNFISVCISVLVTTHAIGMNCCKALFIQVLPIILCSLTAFVLYRVMNLMICKADTVWIILKLLVAGTVYTIIIGTVLLWRPSQIAMSRLQIMKMLHIKKS